MAFIKVKINCLLWLAELHVSSENKIYYILGEGNSGQKFNLEMNEEIQGAWFCERQDTKWKVGDRQGD
jgi:hypothetical protein